MIIDTSALIAILHGESERTEFERVIGSARTRRLTAMAYLETSIVLLRRGSIAIKELDEFVKEGEIAVVDFTERLAKLARYAYARYGRSFHHAGLNFGDCASYALAIDLNEPLLYKGEDFSHTDVISALPPR